MKPFFTISAGLAGFIYGVSSVVLAYSDAPLSLQAFIVVGVTAVGAAAGYLTGIITCSGAQEADPFNRADEHNGAERDP